MPTASSCTVDPDTVQIDGVVELNVTGFPDAPPVALAVNDVPALAGFGAGANEINCSLSSRLSDAGTVD
jgi:hypothetical protein